MRAGGSEQLYSAVTITNLPEIALYAVSNILLNQRSGDCGKLQTLGFLGSLCACPTSIEEPGFGPSANKICDNRTFNFEAKSTLFVQILK